MIPKFRQSSIISEKLCYLSEKIENFDELQLPYSLIFSAETLHTFPTYLCLQNGFQDFFLFCLHLELLTKM